MSCEELENLHLVGGTALALQLGHRKSIDLDLFGEIDFEDIDSAMLFKRFQKVDTLKRSKNINIFNINNIKVDIVNYSYPWLCDYHVHNKVIRIANIRDIAAMKLAAVTGRGSKKDFIDIYFLLQKFSLKQMLSFYNEKYFDGSEYLVLKSMTYFDDANHDTDPIMLMPVEWRKIKETIINQVVSSS